MKNTKRSLNTKKRVMYQQNKSNYFDFSKLTETFNTLLFPFMSFFSVSNMEPSPKNNHGYRKNVVIDTSKSCKRKKLNKKCVTKPNILIIDLKKIEEELKLSSKDRDELKCIVEKIKLNRGENCNNRDKEKIPIKFKNNVRKKSMTDFRSDNFIKEKDFKFRGKSKYKTTKSLKRINCDIETTKIRKELLKESKGNCIFNQQLLTTSPTRYSIHHDNHGEICVKPSSRTTRTILRPNPKVNIANLRLKCVRPICVVQYSTTDNKEDYSKSTLKAHLGEGHCPQFNNPHSSVALKRMTSSYVDVEDSDYVIAKGTLTDELVESFKTLREVRRSLFPESESFDDQSNLPSIERAHSPPRTSTDKSLVNKVTIKENNRNSRSSSSRRTLMHRASKPENYINPTFISPRETLTKKSILKSSLKENMEKPSFKPVFSLQSLCDIRFPSTEEGQCNKSHWDVESFPSTLHKLEKDIRRKQAEKLDRRFENSKSTLSSLKTLFLKTCFCLCFEDDEEKLYKNHQTIPKNRFKLVKGKNMSLTCFKNKGQIIRTTESQFLKETHKSK